MPQHNFDALYAAYPSAIEQMNETFTGHQFIMRLAQNNQAEYVDALYAYRTNLFLNKPAPFRTVHSVLTNHLNTYPHLVENLGYVDSIDIFGQPNGCISWRKVMQ